MRIADRRRDHALRVAVFVHRHGIIPRQKIVPCSDLRRTSCAIHGNDGRRQILRRPFRRNRVVHHRQRLCVDRLTNRAAAYAFEERLSAPGTRHVVFAEHRHVRIFRQNGRIRIIRAENRAFVPRCVPRASANKHKHENTTQKHRPQTDNAPFFRFCAIRLHDDVAFSVVFLYRNTRRTQAQAHSGPGRRDLFRRVYPVSACILHSRAADCSPTFLTYGRLHDIINYNISRINFHLFEISGK